MALVQATTRLTLNPALIVSIRWEYLPVARIIIRMTDGGEHEIEHNTGYGESRDDCHKIIEKLIEGSRT